MARRPRSFGRQKIRIAKIQNKNHLQVTFSKRKAGIFKKASELSILCGVQVAIVLSSPAGKIFSFGNPDVNSLVNRFLRENPPPHFDGALHINPDVNPTVNPSLPENPPLPGFDGAVHMVPAGGNANMAELNSELQFLTNQNDEEQKRGEALDAIWREREQKNWWDDPIEELNDQQLKQHLASLQELLMYVDNTKAGLHNMRTGGASSSNPQEFSAYGHGYGPGYPYF
ncbi:Transcription factor, MADS-box [Dillenia turbinata]|uniref:Transcription factor, MADS-box n=1 Tax=Dillenia turbinata TaxID=194707 RepID=A0AAN8W439_9MAGN